MLAEEGVTHFDTYAHVPGATPQVDMFVDHVCRSDRILIVWCGGCSPSDDCCIGAADLAHERARRRGGQQQRLLRSGIVVMEGRARRPRAGERGTDRDRREDVLIDEPPDSDAIAAPADHSGLAAKRVLVGGAGGLAAAGIALGAGTSWSVAALCATNSASLVFVVLVWASVAGADPAATARIARAEDASRAAAEAVLIGAGAASLLAVAFTLAQASQAHAPARGVLTALAVASVAVAWSSVHTVYALRYARLYYTPPVGGIDFHGDRADYLDFAYLALTIGMTFQVSDTDLMGKRVRRTALRHALTSYVFGTVIVAITVSSVAALLGS